MTRRVRGRVAVLVMVLVVAPHVSGFEVEIHEAITREALARLPGLVPARLKESSPRGFTPTALEEIANANRATDAGDCGSTPPQDDVPATPCKVNFLESLSAVLRLLKNEVPPEEHFDAEKIQEGSNEIFNAVDKIHRLLAARRFVAARKALGRALHGIQDYYAHTNWIEVGEFTDTRLGAAMNAFPDTGLHRLAFPGEPTCVGGTRLLTELTTPERAAFLTKYDPDVLGHALIDRPITSGYFYFWGRNSLPDTTNWTSILTNPASIGIWRRAGALRDDIPVVANGDKCRHGYSKLGVTQPGIAKDSIDPDLIGFSARPGYDRALAAAMAHTNEFVLRVIAEPLRNGQSDSVAGLLGYELVASGDGRIVAPGRDRQAYDKPFPIDLSRYEGGILVIEVQLGRGESGGSFDLYPAGMALPTTGDPIGNVAHAWDVPPGGTATLRLPLGPLAPQRVVFGATGNWLSRVGATNEYSFIAYVENGVPR